MQARLDAAKIELQGMMTRSCWRKEWKDAVTNWSENVIIVELGWGFGHAMFPDENGGCYLLVKYDRATLLPASDSPVHDVGSALHYHWRAYNFLRIVPINLVVDIYRHFVLAFGDTFSINCRSSDSDRKSIYSYNSGTTSRQSLWIDEENKRHHEIIHSSLSADAVDSTSCDRWEELYVREIQLGGKLLPIHYIEPLLSKLQSHQVKRMIEHHFNTEMIQTAQRFANLLYVQQTAVCILIGEVYWNLVNTIGSKNRDSAKNFNLEDENDNRCNWLKILRSPGVNSILSDSKSGEEKFVSLTAADVRFIICCHIDADYDRKETLEKIDKIKPLDASFPTDADDFSNFDPPHLRGVLAETVLSRKLAEYALGERGNLDWSIRRCSSTSSDANGHQLLFD